MNLNLGYSNCVMCILKLGQWDPDKCVLTDLCAQTKPQMKPRVISSLGWHPNFLYLGD